jgi:MFS family permease
VIQPSPTIPATNVTGLRTRAGAVLIGATVLASAVASVDANVVKVAIPAIGHGLHASVGALQWTLTSYLLAVAALLLLSGSLADRFGRRRCQPPPHPRAPHVPVLPRGTLRRSTAGHH